VEIVKRDIKDLREGDTILVEMTFRFHSEIHKSGDGLPYILADCGDSRDIKCLYSPEEYHGVLALSIAKGDMFVWKSTGEVLEVHAITDGIIYGFYQSAPDRIVVTNGSTLRWAGWERIK
jgi:hypothetical protein